MHTHHDPSMDAAAEGSRAAANHSSSGSRAIRQLKTPENRTGMPDGLKSSMENLSGMDLSAVRVHYNSDQPAGLNALAYAQGDQVHIGPGQEHHLAHEVAHVVQQREGRVQPTMQLKDDIPVNADPGLEKEADDLGAEALRNA